MDLLVKLYDVAADADLDRQLADKGITFTAGNQVELDGSKGWVHQDSAPGDTHSVWTNASENLSVTTANNEEADNAAKTILLHNS